MTIYTTMGSVRGSCNHKHRSLETALKCAQSDSRRCQQVRGRSDRNVVRTDGEPLSEWELDELASLEEDDEGADDE